MITFAVIGSCFCLVISIDKICDRLREISEKLDKYNGEEK